MVYSIAETKRFEMWSILLNALYDQDEIVVTGIQ